MRRTSLTLAARYIFPVEGAPLADAVISIERGRIALVEPRNGRDVDLDLGNVAITPGFVNAHTHLELLPIAPPPGSSGLEDQVAWLRRVVDLRRAAPAEIWRDAAARHVATSVEQGTTFVGDTTTAGTSWDALAAAPLRAVVFAELLGLRRERALQTSDEAWTWISKLTPEHQAAARAVPGLSPHAPYSTSGWLFHRAAACKLPLSTHLAELPEELELLQWREGPLREFLEDLDAWDDEWEPIGRLPTDYVRKGELREADWIIAHGTYIEPSEFWQLRPEAAQGDQRVAIAFCPRTHARFGHKPHPYRAMLEHGVVVCIGTDSLASSPSLSVLDEIRFLHRRDPSLGGPLLLTMATLFGAWALRGDSTTGSLRPGKSADLAIIDLPDREARDPHTLLLESDTLVVATMFEGEFVWGPWGGM